MPRLRSNLPPPVDMDADPEVARAITIPQIIVPADGAFKPFVTEQELEDLGERDQKTVFAMSVMEQWGIWQTEELIKHNSYDRQMEAEIIKLKMKVAKLELQSTKTEWKLGMGGWLVTASTAGLIGAFFKWIFEHIGK
jgi:hypothetical protein